jgi:chromosomal replication initiation ATPase DnaA
MRDRALTLLRENHPQETTSLASENALRTHGFWPLLERMCAKWHTLPKEMLAMRKRHPKHIGRARHEMWHEMHTVCSYSYPSIAELFGLEHTTVMFGVEAHARRLEERGRTQENPPKR